MASETFIFLGSMSLTNDFLAYTSSGVRHKADKGDILRYCAYLKFYESF